MPKKPSSPCSPIGFPRTASESQPARICVAIPGQIAAITMDFNITDEEVPEAVVGESDEQAHICLYRCKGELRTIET